VPKLQPWKKTIGCTKQKMIVKHDNILGSPFQGGKAFMAEDTQSIDIACLNTEFHSSPISALLNPAPRPQVQKEQPQLSLSQAS
jgi:hypothetical protein